MTTSITQLEAQKMITGRSRVPAYLDLMMSAAKIEEGDTIFLQWDRSFRLCREGDKSGFLYHRYLVFKHLMSEPAGYLLHTQIADLSAELPA